MSFVYPEFLWGLSALAVPVIIHLFNFRRFRTIYFTNVRFLKNIQEETSTKSKLKHYLVLATRLLAIAFLVLAFAQPFIPSDKMKNKATRHAVSIYLDNSFSMEAANNDEQLINMARRKAEEIVNGYGIDDHFQLLTNNMEAKHQRMLSKDEMLQMIREVQISPEVRSMEEIFKRQKDILQREGDGVSKTIYEISDFQKNAGVIQPDSGYDLELVPLVSNDQRNLTIDSVWFSTPVQMLDQPLQFCMRIKNYGSDAIDNAPVTLKLNDQIKSIADVSVPASSNIIDTLSFTVNTPGWYNCELSIKDYPVTFDDILYFTFQPLSNIPVLCINGHSENDFIHSLYGTSNLFQLQNNDATRIDFNALDKKDLIILNEVSSISTGLAQALSAQLERGGNVILFPPADADLTSYNNFLQLAGSASLGNFINHRRNVTEINTRLPILSDVFEKIPKNLAMPFADQSYEINATSHTLEERIMTFSDGRPLLAKYTAGKGSLYVCATALDRKITDLPVQGGLFVPLMYKIAVSTQRNSALYATIGQSKWITLNDIALAGDETITVKSKSNEFIPEIRKTGIATEINLSAYTSEAGVYSLTAAAGGQNSGQTIALNYNRLESNLSFYNADDLRKIYNTPNVQVISNVDRDLAAVVATESEGTPLWKFCIIFVLIFLAAEILLIRLLP